MGRHSADSGDVTSWEGSVDPSQDDLDEALFAELDSQLNSVRARRAAAPTSESIAAEHAAFAATGEQPIVPAEPVVLADQQASFQANAEQLAIEPPTQVMAVEPVAEPVVEAVEENLSRFEQPAHSSDNWVGQYAVKSDEAKPVKASRLMHKRMHHSAKPKNKDRIRRRPEKSKTPAKRTYGKVATWSAIAFIAGLAIATTVPANAFFTQEQMDAAQSNSVMTKIHTEDGQILYVTGEQAAAARDSVTSAQVARQYDGSTSLATYVNNPNGTIQYPFKTTVRISDLFGFRMAPCAWCSSDHKGVDFDAGLGAPIQIIADGVVTEVHEADDGGLGYYVTVDHDINGLKFQSLYSHLLPGTIQVKLGDQVKVTQIVAQVGNTGTSTGPHLHFEIHVNKEPVDPLAWLKEHAN